MAARYDLDRLLDWTVERVFLLYDARRRGMAGEMADALAVARMAQADTKDYAAFSRTLNRSAGRG